MIKPAILKMVEECRNNEYDNKNCQYDKLCDKFYEIVSSCPKDYNADTLENILSFLTSQEVCEWKVEGVSYHTSCDRVVFVKNGEYCKHCGKIIKKG